MHASKTRSAWLAAAVAFGAVMHVGSCEAKTVYVSISGDDANEGLEKAPVKSLPRALAILRQSGPSASGDRVLVLPGRYALTESIVLNHQDSGADASKPLVIEAQTAGTVTFSGGQELTGFKDAGAGVASAQVDLPRGFHMLWVNGQRATRARSPKLQEYYAGFKNTRTPVPEARPFRPSIPENIENTRSIILSPEASAELMRQLGKSGLKGAVLNVLHSWTSSSHQITHFEPSTGLIRVNPDSFWPFLRFGADQRFSFENLPGMLDTPGEWWASPDGELKYMMPKGLAAKDLRAMVPQLETLLLIEGTATQPVSHIKFKGITFAHSAAWTTPFIDSQAATSVPSAVVAKYARGITFEQCEFTQLGGHGLWFRTGSQNNVVKGSVFSDLGAGGIRIGEEKIPGPSADRVGGMKIEDNLLRDGGRAFPGAVAVWVGQSGGNTIDHNEIHDFFYTAISIGWTWGFGESAAADNLIESNYIHDIGQGVLSDMGGVYVLGKGKGNVIRGNRIEDMSSFRQSGSTAWGIYLDQGASEVMVEQNLVLRTTGGGFHLHFGKLNKIQNNIFGFGKIAQARRSRKDDSDMVFTQNVLISDSSKFYEGEWDDAGIKTAKNMMVGSKAGFSYKKQTLKALASRGYEAGSLTSDSKVACDQEGCRVDAKMAKDIGFKPFSVKAAGVRAGALRVGSTRKALD